VVQRWNVFLPVSTGETRHRIFYVLIRGMDTAAVTAHNDRLSQLPLLCGCCTCIFGMCYFFLLIYFVLTIYYNRCGSVTLFGFKSRETLNMAVVFLRYLLRLAPGSTVARAFPRALQGHLPRCLPLLISVDRSVCFGRLQPSNPPKKRRVL